jgi:hypothetical protein
MADEKLSLHLEALLAYLRQNNVEQAMDQAYEWIKDGTLSFSEWRLFLKTATTELMARERRQEMFRG